MSHIFTGYNGYGYDQVLSTEQQYKCQYLRNIRKKQHGFTVTHSLELVNAPVGVAETVKKHVEFMLNMDRRTVWGTPDHADFASRVMYYATNYCDKKNIQYIKK